MALKELAILLSARGQPQTSGAIRKVTKDVSTLDRVAGRAGKGIKTMGSNLKLLGTGAAIAGVGILAASVKGGIESLVELENVTTATDGAIKAAGKSAKVSADEIRQWSEDAETASEAFFDDKAIQAGANNLVRFGTIGREQFKRTLDAAVDLGAGMKTGPEAASKLLGKALSDPVKAMGALRKAGIVLTAEEQQRIKDLVKGNRVQDAQVAILEAVEKRYKGAAKAAAGPYADAMNILNDTTEDAKKALAIGLMPVITKVANKLSTELAKPSTMKAIKDFGQGLADGLDKALAIAGKIPWGQIGDSLKIAGAGAKAVLDVFTSMPPWVQTAVLTGWGLNKLSGGMLTGIVGEIGKGLIKGVLGMNAGVVNIKAGVVNGGGVPGAGGKGDSIKTILKAVIPLAIAAAVVEVAREFISGESTKQAIEIEKRQEEWLKGQPKREDLQRGLDGVKQGIRDITSNPLLMLVQGEALDRLRGMEADLEAQLAKIDSLKPYLVTIAQATANGRQTINYINGERQASGTGSIGGARNANVTRGAPVVRTPRSGNENNRGRIVLNVKTSISARESQNGTRTWERYGGGNPVTTN